MVAFCGKVVGKLARIQGECGHEAEHISHAAARTVSLHEFELSNDCFRQRDQSGRGLSFVMNTADLSEIDLRRLQLAEIRAMLRLPVNATHQAVIERLRKIADALALIDPNATPERYR